MTCPKCGGEVVYSFHFSFCTECDWDVGGSVNESTKQMLKRMLLAAFDDEEDED